MSKIQVVKKIETKNVSLLCYFCNIYNLSLNFILFLYELILSLYFIIITLNYTQVVELNFTAIRSEMES